MQCAGTKQPHAGRLRDANGVGILFVAHPQLYSGAAAVRVQRPDDLAAANLTWRQHLNQYNQDGINADQLLPAGELYKPNIYRDLINQFGSLNVFILSAGWGLIRGDFVIPDYNITFSQQGEPWARRNKHDQFEDFNHLAREVTHDDTIYFFGAPDYLPLYFKLTVNVGARMVIYSLASAASRIRSQLDNQRYEIVPYETTRRTNWHYGCAQDFMAGRIPS